jgi:hypothetical protein
LTTDVGVYPAAEFPLLVDLTSKDWKSTLDRWPRSRMASPPFKVAGRERKNILTTELLPTNRVDGEAN